MNMHKLGPLAGFIVLALLVAASTQFGAYQRYVFDMLLLTAAAAVALNLVMGCAGLVSIGTAAFLAIGAFGSLITLKAGLPFPLNVACAAIIAGLIGLVVGMPALRIKGLYLALATLAVHYIILYIAQRYQSAQVGSTGFVLAPLSGVFANPLGWTLACAATFLSFVLLLSRLTSGSTGRAWRMVRDHEEASNILGIDAPRFKLAAFMISSALTAFVGGLMAHYDGLVSVDNYGLSVAVAYIAMLVIGGLNSIAGAVIGATIVSLLPQVLPLLSRLLFGQGASTAVLSTQVAAMIYGALIVVFVVFAPRGLAGLFSKLRERVPPAQDNVAAQAKPASTA